MNNLFGMPASTVSAIAAIAAAVISLLAIFLAIWTAWLQRTHNRLSVRPLPEVIFQDVEGHIKLNLYNHGTGPLIIKSLRVEGSKHGTVDMLVKAMPKAPFGWTFFVGVVDGHSVPSGGSINLLELSYRNNKLDNEFAMSVRDALKFLTIIVNSFDIYGKKMPEYRRSLEWFGR